MEAIAVHVGWIWGLPHALGWRGVLSSFELLVAPVMAASRYERQPAYFSDVAVRADSAVGSFTDLRGASWGYNEPKSHSGNNIVRYQLFRLGERSGYFGRVVETGSHQNSLAMILAGELDAAAIDSTVLETEQGLRPGLTKRIRVVDTWGPSPAPPWVVSRKLPQAVRRELRQVLLTMHRESAGKYLLRSRADGAIRGSIRWRLSLDSRDGRRGGQCIAHAPPFKC